MTTPKIQNSQLESGGSGGGDATTEAVSYYADGTSGSDSNDGLTALTPKKTLQAVFDLIPFHVRHNVDVNLEGAFDDDGILDKHVEKDVYLAIDGGSDVTTLGSEFTSNGVDASYIQTASTISDYRGYWVKITSGTNNGYLRTVYYSNTGVKRVYFSSHMNSLSSGDKFIICYPTTTINGTGSIKLSCSGGGNVLLQRLSISSGGKVWSESCEPTVYLTMLLGNSSSSVPAFDFKNCRKVMFYDNLYSGGSFTDTYGTIVGVSDIGTYTNNAAQLNVINDVTMRGVRLQEVEFNNCGIGLINRGSTFVNKVIINNSRSIAGDFYKLYSFESTSNYATTGIYRDGGTREGVDITNSSIGFKDMSLYNCSSHAMIVNSSHVKFISGGSVGVIGTGSSGGGVYLRGNSECIVANSGGAPSITGSAGNITTDGSTQATTWASVYGGTPFSDSSHLCIAKRAAL